MCVRRSRWWRGAPPRAHLLVTVLEDSDAAAIRVDAAACIRQGTRRIILRIRNKARYVFLRLSLART